VSSKSLILGLALFASLPSAALAEESALEPGRLAAVQRRKFRLDHELHVAATLLPLDAFYKGIGPVAGYTWHFGDRLGWEVVRGGYSLDVKTGLREQLESDWNVAPTEFEEAQLLLGSALVFRPLYGKMALLNRNVVHAEMYGLLGGTVAKYTRSFKPGPQAGLGVRFFLSESISFRAEGRYHLLVSKGLEQLLELSAGFAFNLGGVD
jgi:outer membrane beta-barrel protein